MSDVTPASYVLPASDVAPASPGRAEPGAVGAEAAGLAGVAQDLADRLLALCLPDASGSRPALGDHPRWRDHPSFRDRLLFYEYFHAETGRGLGASHQTGWTGLLANLVDELGARGEDRRGPER